MYQIPDIFAPFRIITSYISSFFDEEAELPPTNFSLLDENSVPEIDGLDGLGFPALQTTEWLLPHEDHALPHEGEDNAGPIAHC